MAAASAGLFLLTSAPASAQLSSEGTGNCRVGTTVTTRQGKTGRVETAEGSSCWVRFPDGTRGYFLQWALTPARGGAGANAAAGSSGRAGGAAASGNYQCYGGQAGNMRITISNGRWNEFYAARLPDGRVGISSRPNGAPYYMICERR